MSKSVFADSKKIIIALMISVGAPVSAAEQKWGNVTESMIQGALTFAPSPAQRKVKEQAKQIDQLSEDLDIARESNDVMMGRFMAIAKILGINTKGSFDYSSAVTAVEKQQEILLAVKAKEARTRSAYTDMGVTHELLLASFEALQKEKAGLELKLQGYMRREAQEAELRTIVPKDKVSEPDQSIGAIEYELSLSLMDHSRLLTAYQEWSAKEAAAAIAAKQPVSAAALQPAAAVASASSSIPASTPVATVNLPATFFQEANAGADLASVPTGSLPSAPASGVLSQHSSGTLANDGQSVVATHTVELSSGALPSAVAAFRATGYTAPQAIPSELLPYMEEGTIANWNTISAKARNLAKQAAKGKKQEAEGKK